MTLPLPIPTGVTPASAGNLPNADPSAILQVIEGMLRFPRIFDCGLVSGDASRTVLAGCFKATPASGGTGVTTLTLAAADTLAIGEYVIICGQYNDPAVGGSENCTYVVDNTSGTVKTVSWFLASTGAADDAGFWFIILDIRGAAIP